SPNISLYRCRPLAQLAGKTCAGPTRIRVTLHEMAPCLPVEVGDTLVVPFTPEQKGPERTFVTCIEFLEVDHGYLPGFGLPLAKIMDRFDPEPGGFALRTMEGAPDR
ncbi:MAG: hypothetical protein ABI960_11495, partial [Candidatus Eisenbacteria bacterium]